jgi:hypothetical protein
VKPTVQCVLAKICQVSYSEWPETRRHVITIALEYTIRRALENELKLNGTHQLVAYTDDVNIMGKDIDTIKKNTNLLICS